MSVQLNSVSLWRTRIWFSDSVALSIILYEDKKKGMETVYFVSGWITRMGGRGRIRLESKVDFLSPASAVLKAIEDAAIILENDSTK